MRFGYLLAINMLLLLHASTARQADGQLQAILHLSNDTLKIDSLCASAQQMRYNKPTEALLYGQHALEIAERINYEEGMAKAYTCIGMANWIKGDNVNALDAYLQALELHQALGDLPMQGTLLNNVAHVYEREEQFDKAHSVMEQAIAVYEQAKDDLGIALTLTNLGNLESEMGSFDAALVNHLRALRIKEALGNRKEISRSLNSIGIIYDKKGDYEKALEYFQQALDIKKGLSDLRGIGYNLHYMGTLHRKMGSLEQALAFFEESLQVKSGMNDQWGKVFSLLEMSEVHGSTGARKRAIAIAEEALEVAHQLGAKSEISRASLLLAEYYAQLKNYREAFRHQQTHLQYKDSLLNEENIRRLEAMKHRHDLLRKDAENDLLRKEKEMGEKQLRRQQVVIVSVSVALFFAGALIWLLYSYSQEKRKANRVLKDLNEEITSQKETMGHINANLEKLVAERTLQLEKQNKQLIEYAFFNAHKVRGPLARILGLLYLMQQEFQDAKLVPYIEMMQLAASDLDSVVHEINALLEKEGLVWKEEGDA